MSQSKRIEALKQRMIVVLNKEQHTIDSITSAGVWDVYFELKSGCATEDEQKNAANLLEKYNILLNMLIEADKFKESITFNKETDKYVYRGNEYDSLYSCILKETRNAFGCGTWNHVNENLEKDL
jgi:cyanate lyase